MNLSAMQCNFIYETILFMITLDDASEMDIRRTFMNFFNIAPFTDEQIENISKAIKNRFYPDEL